MALDEVDNPHISEGLELKGYHSRVAALVAKYLQSDGALLDFGCGWGYTSALVREARPDIHVDFADIAQSCLDASKQRVPDAGTFLIEDHTSGVHELPADRMYEGIILSHVLEHAREPLTVLNDVVERIRPNGFLFLAVPNLGRPNVAKAALSRTVMVNPGHVYGWDPSHWRNFLENIAGLDVVEYAYDDVRMIPFAPKSRILRKLEWKLGGVFPWWSISNIAVIRQPAAESM